MTFVDLLSSVNRKIHPNDSLAPVYRRQFSIDEYFRSGLSQVDALDALTRTHLGQPITALGTIADFACHYGRLLRAIRVAAPQARLVACDIDADALAFCQEELGAAPFHTAWSPAGQSKVPAVDLLICISLLTHTRRDFLRDALKLWARMLRPEGLLVFTFLGDHFLGPWRAGEMGHYGPASAEDIARVANDFERDGHAFHSYPTSYSQTEYGVGFLSEKMVTEAIAATRTFDLLELTPGPDNAFGQDIAVVRRRRRFPFLRF